MTAGLSVYAPVLFKMQHSQACRCTIPTHLQNLVATIKVVASDVTTHFGVLNTRLLRQGVLSPTGHA